MNGPEHYREAERLMGKAFDGETLFTPDVRARLLAGAQVHATLALAAATATGNRQNPDGPPGMGIEDQDAWDAVAGVRP